MSISSSISSSEFREPAGSAALQIPGVAITRSVVDFFGIPLLRGYGGAFAPSLDAFRNDIVTAFDIQFMKDLVVAWTTQGIPLFEGGSGIGKSRGIERIGAILNQEVYKIQGNEDVTPAEIFGRMGIVDGTVSGLGFIEKSATLALKNGGILWFDEPNALPPESHIRLRELLDAISSGKRYFELAEDIGERRIQIHPLTRVVLTQNEADGKNSALAAIRAPDFGRLNYIRLPEVLPPDARRDRMLGRLGIASGAEEAGETRFSYHEGFSVKQFGELLESSAMRKHFFSEYRNFVSSVKQLVIEGKLARDQRQPIYFDRERDSIKFLRYLAVLHGEDLEASSRDALRYVFGRRFLTEADRAQVEELVLKFSLEVGNDDDRIEADSHPERTLHGQVKFPASVLSKSPQQIQFEQFLKGLKTGISATIGRHPECNFVLNHSGVSRKHFSLTKQDSNTYLLIDLGSTNGTLLNDVRIGSATASAGNEISIGPIRLTLPNLAEPVVATLPPPPPRPFRVEPAELGYDTVTRAYPDDFFNRAYQFKGAHGASDSWSSGLSASLAASPAPGVTALSDRVSFLGAELPKAKMNLERRVPVEFFADDVLTEYDIRLMKTIAATWELGQIPILEGGPGIGKSRTADRMGAYLGQEVYYQLAGKFPPRVLFGKMTTSEHATSGLQYADGKATLAARNGGLLFIDEANALAPGTWVYLRDLIDAYLAKKPHFTMLLAGKPQRIPIHRDFRIILSQNEARPGDPELIPLQDADFNRLVYIKLFDEMPDHIFEARFLGRLGEKPDVVLKDFEALTTAYSKTRAELGSLLGSPQMAQRMWRVYDTFFESLRADLGKGLAAGRHQEVFLNYERLEERILDHFMHFYDGDFLRSLRASVYHYCCNLFASEPEKKLVREKFKSALQVEPELLAHMRNLRPA